MSLATGVPTTVDKTRRTRALKFVVIGIIALVVLVSLLDLYCVIDLDGLC